MKGGLAFESAFGGALRLAGCMAVTCDRWDREEKTDILVMRVDGRGLRFPMEVQVTLQCDNLLKLASYVAYHDARRAGEMRRSLYVEVEPGVAAATAADAVKRLLLALDGDRRSAGPFGLRVGKAGESRFDPREKRAELALRASPERTAHLRFGGAIVEVRPNGVLIVTASHGLFWAYDGDIADRRLREIVRMHRAGRRSAFGTGVSLIADGMSREHGRAKSIICAPSPACRGAGA